MRWLLHALASSREYPVTLNEEVAYKRGVGRPEMKSFMHTTETWRHSSFDAPRLTRARALSRGASALR